MTISLRWQTSYPEVSLTVRAAAVQLASGVDTAVTYAPAEQLVRDAVAAGADLVVLPEMWNCFGAWDVMTAAAEREDGPTTQWASELARKLSIDLIAGSFLQLVGDDHFNTSLHVAPNGEVRARYRKIHMFDVEVGGTEYHESDHERAGSEIMTTELAGGIKAGLAICYDLRFPELFRIQAVEGAKVTVLPSAFTEVTTKAHWMVLLRARAIENQTFVVAANQCGETELGRWGGESTIIDPWGTVLAELADEVGFVTAELDFEHQNEIRNKVPSLANRKPNTYLWPDH